MKYNLQRVVEEYDGETKIMKNKYKRNIPLCVLGIFVILIVASFFCGTVTFWITIVFSIISSIAASVCCNLYADNKVIKQRNKERESAIQRITDERFQKKWKVGKFLFES